MTTDRELLQQTLEALMDAQLHNYALKHKETDDLITALRERLAQPQPHEIAADINAVGMAIQDTFVCGTGVLKLWFDGGKMQFDHVPIKDFNVFGDELKWRAAHTVKEKTND